ncbi:polyprenyl synthetase family protein [Streptomyces sp. NPDC000410]|uniref:polyprenyl synthetase family protein n=1 Tax=Streptomyces sp. NPDC000410 TaxID=3154254 RepID=UPI00331FFDCA
MTQAVSTQGTQGTHGIGTVPLDLITARRRVDAALAEFLEGKARAAAARPEQRESVGILRDFVLAGGKRIRATLCVTGCHAAGGGAAEDLLPALVRVAAALEMFHAFALIHDDVMDRSPTRRGRPTVHRRVAAQYGGRRGADRLGESAAVLIGDLALVWSDELLHTAGLSGARLDAVLRVMDTMRADVMHGQYLDLIAAGRPTDDMQLALDIAHFKTTTYTVEHPLLLGAALATAAADTPDTPGAEALRSALTAYARPVGEAFQLRDDLLGAFGDPATTGKPVLDDFRDGKHTVLLALALRHADAGQARVLRALTGRPDLDDLGAARIRRVLRETGAPARVEAMIDDRLRRALAVLDGAALPAGAATALREIAYAATARTA